MRTFTAARWVAVLVFGIILIGGCKKETPQKTEVPQTAPAPQPPPAQPEQARSGESLFNEHCTACHPDGGNVVKPKHTLHGKSLAAHKITKLEDIVQIMRNPESGMTKFDETTISDKDATAIADYILNTFK